MSKIKVQARILTFILNQYKFYAIMFVNKPLSCPVPPNRPTIFDAKRRDRTKLVEPYNEGSNVLLICEVEGGKTTQHVDIRYWNKIDFEHQGHDNTHSQNRIYK